MEILQSLGVEGPKVLANVAAFLIFFAILYKFAWKDVGDALEDRRRRIATQLDDLDRGKKEIEQLRQDYLSKIRAIEAEAQLRFGRIEAEARDKSAEILAEASGKAHKYLEGARKDIEMEVAQARRSLVAEVAALARAAAEKVLERQINDADSQRLVESFLAELERSRTAV